ncbi:MAG: IclR family transcriptional regulator, partial [Chloroflexota bacterium]|nr:IclR family transcriptional regulator [Chloroflexota bacterium]
PGRIRTDMKQTARPSGATAGGAGGGTRALDRATDLVAAVVGADSPLSFTHLQESSGLAKSTASRILAALERSGLLERDADGSYVAGQLFWLYAARHDPWEELVRLARPTMELISDTTLEAVHLSVVRGDRVTQVAQVNSQFLLGTRDWTAIDVPAHSSALGKVFYAWDVLPIPGRALERLTDATLTDPDALRQDAQLTRHRGWAVTHDELEVGLTGVAVPVRGPRGQVVASLGISGPTPRLADRLDELGHQLSDHAARLSRLLSGSHEKDVA